MQKLLLTSTIAGMLLFLVNYRFESESHETRKTPVIENPIDHILGEHYYDNGTIRPANFDSILHVPAKHLSNSSRYYNIIKLRPGLFLLKRKQFYIDNRPYSLIVETKNNKIVNMRPFVDLAIRDAVYESGKLYLLQGDYTVIGGHWRPTYSIKISCTDCHFRELWSVSSLPDKGAFFLGYSLSMKDKKLLAGFGIQNEGSSTMCISDYILFLSENGEILGSAMNGGYQCGAGTNVPLKYLSNLFTAQKL